MVVMKLNDEFQVLAALGLSAESQNLIGGSVDQVILDTSVQESNANRKKIKELYFNVSRPMTELRENLQKKG
ncbi:MAG: hypothetical protein KDD36_03435, partial [Flavobacteriales bacterium]|nr:hypothetical protein [Flavobacteriales bacterium]